MHVGIAGAGKMGAAIATRLMAQGFRVTVWNRARDKTLPLAEAGASIADTPAALASECELILSILTDASAIAATYHGPQGLLSPPVQGKLFIEMSTVRPETQRALAARVSAAGAALMDCPVSGTTGPAREGKLIGLAGANAADLEWAMPVLSALCRRVEHVGPVGSGASLKLALNLPLLVYWQAVSEALSLCQPLNLDPERLVSILADSSGGPNALKTRGSMLADALRGQAPAQVTFDMDSIRKDLQTMIEEARALGYQELPVAAQTLQCYDTVARAGFGKSDAMLLPMTWLQRKS